MVRSQVDQRGQRLDLGGYKLRFYLVGEGDPAVIFDSGLGDGLRSWDRVQPEISKLTRTLSYDRAGIDQSDPGPLPRSTNQMVDELHHLLQITTVSPPYVLVGHSLGGFNIRLFAHRYPEKVAGLVLVDASHEDLWRHWAELRTPEEWTQLQKKLDSFYEDEPEGVLAEWRCFPQNTETIREACIPSNVPTVMLSSSFADATADALFTPEDMQVKLNLHRKLVEQLPHGRHIVTAASGHYIQKDEPDLVIGAILEVVHAFHGQQLSQ